MPAQRVLLLPVIEPSNTQPSMVRLPPFVPATMPARAASSPKSVVSVTLLRQPVMVVLPKLTPMIPASSLPSALPVPLMVPVVWRFLMVAPLTHLNGAAKRLWLLTLMVSVCPSPSKMPLKGW